MVKEKQGKKVEGRAGTGAGMTKKVKQVLLKDHSGGVKESGGFGAKLFVFLLLFMPNPPPFPSSFCFLPAFLSPHLTTYGVRCGERKAGQKVEGRGGGTGAGMTKKKVKQVLLKDHSGGGGAGRIKVLIRFVLNSVISKRALLTGDMQFPVFKLLYSGILGFIERNLISGMH